MTPQQRLLGQSALQAFRSDIFPGAAEATADDQSAVLVATLLRQSLLAPDEGSAGLIRRKALDMASDSLGTVALAEGCTYDDFPAVSLSDVIRLLAQRTDRAGRLYVAQHLLESAAEIEVNPVDSGRLLAERARVTRKLGFLDLSAEQCHELLRQGRRLRSAELITKAHLGLAALANTRGNFVEYRAKLRLGMRIASANGLQRLRADCYSGMGTSSALQGRYGEAVAYYWKAHELSGGKGHIAFGALSNLGQTLLISGRPKEARKIAALVLQTAPEGTLAPALGMLAVASAQVGDQEAVVWAAKRLSHFTTGRGNAKEIAEALMECSAALNAISKKAEARVMKRRSEEMAVRYGFHGLTFQEAMQSIQRISEPSPFNQAAVRATAAIDGMEVPRIPELFAALPQ